MPRKIISYILQPSGIATESRIKLALLLKKHHGSLDVEALLILVKDEKKTRLINLIAGMDAKDANVSGNRLGIQARVSLHDCDLRSSPTRNTVASCYFQPGSSSDTPKMQLYRVTPSLSNFSICDHISRSD